MHMSGLCKRVPGLVVSRWLPALCMVRVLVMNRLRMGLNSSGEHRLIRLVVICYVPCCRSCENEFALRVIGLSMRANVLILRVLVKRAEVVL